MRLPDLAHKGRKVGGMKVPREAIGKGRKSASMTRKGKTYDPETSKSDAKVGRNHQVAL